MRKLLIGLLILGGVLAVVAVMKRRSGSELDEWDSFAAGDPYTMAKEAAATVSDAAATVSDAAKDAASTATKAAKDA